MNTLKINGTTLTGIYVDAAVSFNKPAKRVSEYSIPGRNGNLVIDEGTFDNVLISYPVYEKNTFPTEFDNLVNWLASLEGYQRIECSNDPQHYRLGRFVVPETPTAKRLNKDGYYTLVFDCKPQRYLLSGEVETEITNAEVVIASDSEPYLFRKSGGAQDIGDSDRETPTLIGGTVAWNQLVQASREDSSFGGLTFTRQSTYSTKVSGTTDATTNVRMTQYTNMSFISGHKYFISWGVLFPSGCNVFIHAGDRISASDKTATIWACGTTETSYPHLTYLGNTAIDVTYTLCIIDLTLAFGSTIADYLYTLESGTAGAGIAKLKEWGFLTKPYYAYDAGSLQSVNASEHRTVERNIYNADDDFSSYKQADGSYKGTHTQLSATKVYFPQAFVGKAITISAYCEVASGSVTGIRVQANINGTNTNGNTVSESTYVRSVVTVTPQSTDDYWRISYGSGTGYIQFKDVMVEFGSTATAYEPYESHSYALDSSLTLRGIPKLDANNNLYYDGDTYESDGKVTRKYGIRAYASGDATDGSTMITDGTNTVYKLTTPTEETAEGYTNPQVVDVDGTEEYTDYGVEQGTRDVAIPVGHSTDYFNQLGYIITNPTYFKSKPKIRVYGSGTFTVDNMTITVAAHSQPYIDIDSETETCEYDGTNMSQYVTLSSNDYPELAAGQNGIMPTPGITKLGVTPRWWIL